VVSRLARGGHPQAPNTPAPAVEVVSTSEQDSTDQRDPLPVQPAVETDEVDWLAPVVPLGKPAVTAPRHRREDPLGLEALSS
jgi:hypothetical protein